MQSWLTMTAADLGRGIGRGEIDPLTLCQTYLDAIDAHPLRDRIYARVTHARALAEAKAASERAKSGHRLSLLDGVPVSWKDLFDSAGTITEAGSKLLAGRVPDRDAVVLSNATAAGLVCLGKTHMSELAFSGLGHNPSTATSPCVNDESAVSGGSSSGAAASVAFGLAAAGIGTDTGGSVRIPSAWNDLVGLKTTSGRLTLEGVVPLAMKFDTIGPLCRSVEDAALLLGILEGNPAPDLRNAEVEGLRFAVLKNVALEDIRDEPLNAFNAAIAKLREAGAIIDEIDVDEVSEAMPLATCLFTTEAYGLWRDVIEANPDAMYEEILMRFRLGQNHSGADYVASWAKLDALRARYDAAVAGYDAVLVPSAPILPPNLDRLEQDHEFYLTENLLALRNTRIGNLMGLCALTLPTDTPSCGLMMMCPPDMEELLLRLGAAVEDALR
ncbi:Amidase [Sulfitobacter noctilucicola]|uniref:Aspartyl-tRNA(Asn)/glutamyl-tRNA(Gln) amidotransferase subunit A n=1 Tax=Sulfitobacter noctilucicola TaxID=1342301 RepID=A0A7W6M4L7_9RHOB|nr:amidase family protein [Sulfitobacter noctilucicola]KIN63139.1 Amidase [Sulfitobacter noctilucicola]MBB4172335.1 aspartyl-tRNA(Asn)/glutamyl-tRNA(Gln) amidotransferase subunit A [Sulfitobacter noctilucicola]